MPGHAMRRKDRMMDEAGCLALLEKGEYGFLATVGPDGRPYGVPLSYVWRDGRLFFHCASMGRKIKNIINCPDVSFSVVGDTKPVYVTDFSTYYKCVMIFGKVGEVADPDAKYEALYALAEKYLPDHMDKADKDIRGSLKRTAVYAITPVEITGKAKLPKGE